jgi:hypothetical protein
LIKVTNRGSFKNLEDFGRRVKGRTYLRQLAKYGPIGVAALKGATPVESGKTAEGWYFEIVDRPGYYAIHWYNSHVENGLPIAVLIQYGHATRQGGIVEGRDYINPAIRPIFDQMAIDMWKEVTK